MEQHKEEDERQQVAASKTRSIRCQPINLHSTLHLRSSGPCYRSRCTARTCRFRPLFPPPFPPPLPRPLPPFLTPFPPPLFSGRFRRLFRPKPCCCCCGAAPPSGGNGPVMKGGGCIGGPSGSSCCSGTSGGGGAIIATPCCKFPGGRPYGWGAPPPLLPVVGP